MLVVQVKMWSNEKSFSYLIDHRVCVWIATHQFIIEGTHFLALTHTDSGDFHSLCYWCTDNCLAPIGLPIHCNPSNTLNFHFKQKLNRQKTQGSILLPPPVCFFGFFFSQPHFCRRFSASFLVFQPLVSPSVFSVFVKFNTRTINDASTKKPRLNWEWIWSDTGHNSIFAIIINSSLPPMPVAFYEKEVKYPKAG